MFIADKDFQAGYIAAQQGESKSACPMLFDAKPRKMWLAGHDFALLEKSENPPEEQLERVNKSPFEQGRNSFKQGVAYEDNPYGTGDPFGTPEEVETYASNRDWHSGYCWEKAGGGTISGDGDVPWQLKELEPVPNVYTQFGAEHVIKPHGGYVSYYVVRIDNPQREEHSAYIAECEDISRALQMTPDEFCEFKAIWRTAAARLGNTKPGHNALYDAQKRVHYATICLALEMRKQGK